MLPTLDKFRVVMGTYSPKDGMMMRGNFGLWIGDHSKLISLNFWNKTGWKREIERIVWIEPLTMCLKSMCNFHFVPSIHPLFSLACKSCSFSNKEYTVPREVSFNPHSRTCFFETSNPAAWQAVLSSARVPRWPNGWKPCSCSRVSRWVAELVELGGAGGCDFCINLGLYIYICIFISIHIKGKEDD